MICEMPFEMMYLINVPCYRRAKVTKLLRIKLSSSSSADAVLRIGELYPRMFNVQYDVI